MYDMICDNHIYILYTYGIYIETIANAVYTHYIATSEQKSPTSSDHPIPPVWLPGPDSFEQRPMAVVDTKMGVLSHQLLDAKLKHPSISLLNVGRSWYFSGSFDAILQSKELVVSVNMMLSEFLDCENYPFGTYLAPEVWIGLQAKRNITL